MTDASVETVTLPRPPLGCLVGTLALAAPQRSSLVLYVHGFGSDRGGIKAATLQTACRAAGLNFAAFDFHCHGGSSGRPMTDLRASGLLEDLTVIRQALRARGIDRLFLVGSSMGGFAASWFAARHPGAVAGLTLLAPAFRFLENRILGLTDQDLTRWREQRVLRLRNQWLDVELDHGLVEERGQFAPETLADTWQTPALIFHGMNDETVPWRDTLSLVERTGCGAIELRLFRAGDHRLLAHAEQMAEEACRFFQRRGA